MSVNRELADLPFQYVPKRYARLVEGAKGNNSSSIFLAGDAPFKRGPIDAVLHLECPKPGKGLIGPETKMPIQSFQAGLAATQDAWKEVKDDGNAE